MVPLRTLCIVKWNAQWLEWKKQMSSALDDMKSDITISGCYIFYIATCRYTIIYYITLTIYIIYIAIHVTSSNYREYHAY